jgi:hypothetical protein
VIDTVCSQGKQFADDPNCKDSVISVEKATVNEVLTGSKIVKNWEEKGNYYSVAVLPKKETSEKLVTSEEDSIKKTEAAIKQAEGNPSAAQDAKKEYLKTVAIDKERKGLGGNSVIKHMEQLEKEMAVLTGK